MTVFEKLESQYNTESVNTGSDIYVKDIPEDIFYYIKDSVLNITDTMSMYQKSNSPVYETLALTYNPYLNAPGYQQYSRNIGLGENGRDDTHSFVHPLPNCEFLFSICEYTPLKAKITRMEGRYDSTEWHHDEPIDECIKVVIPVVTESQCLFQMDNRKPINLEVGKAYFFNSLFHHRYLYGKCDNKITHLVFGLSTKYQYDYSKGQWYDPARDTTDIATLIDNSVVF